MLTMKKKPREASFGARLKALRLKAELTQAQLADKAGLIQQTVSHLEAGIRQPNFATACRLADALGVDVSELRSS